MTVKTTSKETTLSDKTTYELRVLEQDVQNPAYDGRKRHGAAAIKTFPARTRFVVATSIETYGDKVVSIPSIELIDDSGDILSRPIVQAMIAASVVLEPTTWAELLAARGWRSMSRSANAEVLEMLYQDPDLRPALLARLAKVTD